MEDRLRRDFEGESSARHEVRVIAAQAASWNSICAYLEELRRGERGNEVVHAVVDFCPRPPQEILVTNTEVEGQAAADFVVVLRVEGKIGLPEAACAALILVGTALRSSEKQV